MFAGDLSKHTIDYFLVPKFVRFYLLPKIYKQLHATKTSHFKSQLVY